jgi:hypothetical protein
MAQRFFELGELFSRTVYFKFSEFGEAKYFPQEFSNISEMSQYSFRISIPFAAMSFVAVETESVEKRFFLGIGHLDESIAVFFELRQRFVSEFKVRDDSATGI